MMRAAVLALALVALPAAAQNGPPTVVGEIVKLRQSVGELRGQVADLTTRLAAAEAKVTKHEQDVSNLAFGHNVLVQFLLLRGCDFNRTSAAGNWVSALVGLKPIALPPDMPCPPEGTRFYWPYFHGGAAPVVPPQ